MEADLHAAIKILQEQNHTVRPFEIDGHMLATRQEMLDLADGVYSLQELAELFARRHAEGKSKP